MSKKLLAFFCLMFVVNFLFLAGESHAMPNFARKYNADCTMCHTQVPKLNRIGYEFRMAGYRLPSEIGKEEKPFNLGDFFAARFQEQYTWDSKSPVSGSSTSSSQLQFVEFTFYPLAGSWGKYFGSLGEFSLLPDENFEVENAYVRGAYGNENGWLQGRIGIFHPFEGFGASDRPLGNTRPLFQTQAATGSPFKIWGIDQSGLEAGYYLASSGTTISLKIFNGIRADGEPAQGGNLTKQSSAPAFNDKDLQVFLTQFIRDDSAISVEYYRGAVPFPATGTQTRDTYDRYGIYANFWPLKGTLNILGGYGYGHDSLSDSTVSGGTSVGNSKGFFGEVDYHVLPGKLALGGRYDQFDPTSKVDHNTASAETLTLNYYILHGVQFIGDYVHKDTEVTTGGSNKEDQVLARLIFIW